MVGVEVNYLVGVFGFEWIDAASVTRDGHEEG
jgi:hypothetical protein